MDIGIFWHANGKARISKPISLLIFIAVIFGLSAATHSVAHAQEPDWTSVTADFTEKLEQIPDAYADNDQEAVEQYIRQAYYEVYQVSTLEAQIDHRLGEDRNQAFVDQLLSIREITRAGGTQADVDEAVAATIAMLETDVQELGETPELNDQWSRVASRAVAQLDTAASAYTAGDFDAAANAARDAYLAHYEADGLEKASISYLGQGRVGQLESQFTQLRQAGRDGKVSAEEYSQMVEALIADLEEDAAALDELTSTNELGWSGFWASFTILLREGAEALLVVAALITYAKRAGRKDQVAGIIVGVAAALVVAAAVAVLFTMLTASAASGLGQELIEGITGLLATIMLIWVSNWILSKSSGKKWEHYIKSKTQKQTATGGVFALASVAFLAVLREGAETILFFSPILAASKNSADVVRIWCGVGTAVVLLAVMFMLVWVFGVRLPLKAFFRWTSVLLGVLAVTIAGGAVKEFQDATLVSATAIPGVPTVSILGIYPTVETLATQMIVIVILITLAVLQARANLRAAVEPLSEKDPLPSDPHGRG